MSDGRRIPAEALVHLRRRLDTLPSRHPDRAEILRSARELYGVSRATLYRALQQSLRPKALRRADRGKPRKIPAAEMERYCEIVAALKLRTTNRKGRHLSTVQAIRLMEEHGVETPEGLVQPAPCTLHKATVNRYLRAWGLDYARVTRAPAAVRFQARRSNELWQFDMSPSDLKHIKQPLWIEPGRGAPTLMLFSVADDRSGVVYQEYRCVYGEDAESALRFLYNAMAAKPEEDMPFQGIPEAIYMDNGPVELAERIGLPRAALDGGSASLPPPVTAPAPKVAFADPDPYRTLAFSDIIAAKRAIAGEIGLAFAKLSAEDRAWIDALVRETLAKDEVLTKVRAYFRQRTGGGGAC